MKVYDQNYNSFRGMIMIKKLDLSLFFGLLILMIVVSISGCVHSSSNGTQKYDDEFISFDYPGDFQYTSGHSYIVSGGLNWRNVLTLGNGKVFINIIKNEDATNLTPSEVKEIAAKSISEKDIADKGGKYLSDSHKTNDNGVEVESTITSINYPYDKKIVYKYVTYYFKADTDVMYSIIIYGEEKNFVDVQSVADTVFNSLKINK